jgi:hypothetical protein
MGLSISIVFFTGAIFTDGGKWINKVGFYKVMYIITFILIIGTIVFDLSFNGIGHALIYIYEKFCGFIQT